ncbi:HTH-type transcriptional activator IlvY [Litoribacillus peritrichatus]|uniref:HTH-type transcriptional activator IlvY n=1 Tax=Litoribacillus peritrichatus TaxID=718191 RepID=A0ABP7ME65_9GAMM
MEYKDLEVFVLLAEHQNLGVVSQLIHCSSSTLSRRLKRMEEGVGANLFDREGTRLRLTEEGELFRQHSEQALELWRQFKLSVQRQASELQGQLSIYCSVTASYSFLSELLSRFRAQHPLVDIRLITGDAAESIPHVQSGEADVVIAARPDQLPANLTFKTITTAPLLFIAPVGLQTVPELLEDDIAWDKVPLVLSETGLARTRVDRWFKKKRLKQNIYAQVSGHEAIVSMVSLGCGVGVVPDLVLKNSPLMNKVRIMEVLPELEPFAVGLCAQNKRLNEPLIAALWQTVMWE